MQRIWKYENVSESRYFWLAHLRMNQTKIDTLSKAQTRKMTPYVREEQKGEKRCMMIR